MRETYTPAAAGSQRGAGLRREPGGESRLWRVFRAKRAGTVDARRHSVAAGRLFIRVAVCMLTVALAAAHVAAVRTDHPACVSAHHGCGSAAIVSPCCCGGQSQASRSSGLTLSRYRAAAGTIALRAIDGPSAAVVAATIARAPVWPPTLAPPDITILVANLRL